MFRAGIAGLLLAITAVRLIIAVVVPLDLAGDESYYWEWGRHLSSGYYSKPPLIAWLMAFLSSIGGDTEIGIRLLAIFFGTMTLIFLTLLARDMFGETAAFRTGVLLSTAPIALPVNLLLTIDSPLACCWSGALLSAWKISEAKHESSTGWHWVLALTLSAGVLAKQIMLIFPLLWVTWLAVSPAYRPVLFRPATWLVLMAPAIALVPPMLWNMNEGWVTFEHTASHFDGKLWTLQRAAVWLSSFVASQLILWGPVTVTVGTLMTIRLFAGSRSLSGSKEGFLAAFAIPLAFTLGLALRQPVLPNWPAMFWLSTVVLAASALGPRGWLWSWLSSAALSTILLTAVLLAPMIPGSKNPFERVLGWNAYAAAIARVDMREWPDRIGIEDRRVVLVYGHRYFASAISFYHPERPFSRVFQSGGIIRTQYGIWDRRFPLDQPEALIVTPGDVASLPAELRPSWSCADRLGVQRTPIGRNASRTVTLWRAYRKCH
jgi:4-amino-4-deoxy-L-arabinose transferase-like glycosyltransferase